MRSQAPGTVPSEHEQLGYVDLMWCIVTVNYAIICLCLPPNVYYKLVLFPANKMATEKVVWHLWADSLVLAIQNNSGQSDRSMHKPHT